MFTSDEMETEDDVRAAVCTVHAVSGNDSRMRTDRFYWTELWLGNYRPGVSGFFRPHLHAHHC